MMARPMPWMLSALILLGTTGRGEDRDRTGTSSNGTAVEPTPLQDDANLHAIQFVGSKTGWIAGDHGVVWRTTDGGQSWTIADTHVDCALRGLCFLTDRVGWVVGGDTRPYSRVGYGVVLYTMDGGQTWEQLAGNLLPPLCYVKFFGLREGIAVGAASAEHPTGVFVTDDGGRKWRDAVGSDGPGWWAANFLSTDAGVVVGPQGRIAPVFEGRVLPGWQDRTSLHGFHAIQIGPDGNGWLAGDGGRMLTTTTGGASWQLPPAEMPRELGNVLDFRAVSIVGNRMWAAGRPGSTVWHTPDGGKSWIKQRTGQPAPIEAIEFTSEKTGWAVGALGTILHTDDGGYTWRAVRGGDRRVAFMSAIARPEKLSCSLVARYSGALGYRSAAWMISRSAAGRDETAGIAGDLAVRDAVTAIGGSAAEIEWRFPIEIPGLAHDKQKLIAEWNARHEGRFNEVMLGAIVRALRTWRPSVVVIDQPSPDDAAAVVLHDMLLEAVKQAADPTRYVEQADLAGLDPWQVSKIYMCLAEGSTADVIVDSYEFLPRLGTSLRLAAAAGYGRVRNSSDSVSHREAYRLIVDNTSTDGELHRGGDLFANVGIAPGSAARRTLPLIDEDQLARNRRLAALQRNVNNYAERYFDDPRHASQIIAQLGGIVSEMPNAQGALQLADLASEFRRRSQWDLVETTLVELVNRYPDQPPAADAMRWLFQYWSSAETNFRRLKTSEVVQSRTKPASDVVTHASEFVFPGEVPSLSPGVRPVGGLVEQPPNVDQQRGSLKVGANATWDGSALRLWHDKALKIAKTMRTVDPALFGTSEIQFPLAALERKLGAYRSADKRYRDAQQAGSADSWKQTAQGELWLIQPAGPPIKPTVRCKFTPMKPALDGLLSDACWQDAEEIQLTKPQAAAVDNRTLPLVMLAYDARYLYLAASVPRDPAVPADMPELAGRTHDADLSRFDRLGVYFDVDRDYVTYYAFHVDQRGWTAEACWEDEKWNPDWYVAAAADNSHWRIEVAIPLEALVPAEPLKNNVWAVGIVRTIPTRGLESWTHPAEERPRPETFGLVRFD